MVETIVTGHADRTSRLKKFVITAFADVPRPGYITCYAEVCAASTEPFVVLLPSGTRVKSRHDLYFDGETCRRFLSEYTPIDGVSGRHKQRVGDEILDVTPSQATISVVAPPESHKDATACLVTFPGHLPDDSLHGTWLVWSHPAQVKLSGRPSAGYLLTLRTVNARLDHLYLFLVLPLGHEAVNPICLLGSATTPMDGTRPTNPVHEFELEPPFPVFPEWRTWIYGRRVLRSRDDVALEPFEQAALQLKTRSEGLQGRITTLAYLTGIGFALSAEFLVNALFFIQDNGLTTLGAVEALGGIALLLITGVAGWKTVRKT